MFSIKHGNSILLNLERYFGVPCLKASCVIITIHFHTWYIIAVKITKIRQMQLKCQFQSNHPNWEHLLPHYNKLTVLQIITREGEIFVVCSAFVVISLFSNVQCRIFYVTTYDLPIAEPTVLANPFNSIKEAVCQLRLIYMSLNV